LPIICFDLDGTLCDSATAEKAACREVVNRIISLGFKPYSVVQVFDTQYQAYEERYVDLVISGGLGEKEIRLMQITDTLKAHGVEDRSLAAELSAAHWSTMSRLFTYYPEVPQALECLRERHRVSLLSNGPSDLQRQKIRALGLDGCFEHVVISGEVGYSKPSREIFEELLNRINAQPNQVIYIGDNYMKDIVGALGAGLRAVWVNRDGRERPSHPLKPERTIRDLSELARVLE